MPVPTADILALRALQATRRLHPPSYVALRYLVETAIGRHDSIWTTSALPRKFPQRKEARFHSALKFKKLSPEGLTEYREFMVPSPTTALTEAVVLAHLSQAQSFAKPTCVYSYLWPQNKETSPFNFEHYVSGYKARNNAIANFVGIHPRYSLIVSDIEKFYPSIRRESVRGRFRTSLENSGAPIEIKETAIQFLEQLFALVPGDKGVATGPNLSHVVGDIALRAIDEALSRQFPGAYFRYVDDIVIAVPEGNESKALAILRNLVAAEGLGIQEEKNEVISGAEWVEHGPHHSAGVKQNSFEALIFLIKAYLSRHAEGKESLALAFEERGYSIPLERFAASAKNEHFTSRLKKLFRRGWWVAIRGFIATEQDVLRKAESVRGETLASLKLLLRLPMPIGASRRKWHVQKLRYLTNRALYLFPDAELQFLVPMLAEYPEFIETVALLKVLNGGDLEGLLRLPGAAVSACGGLLSLKGRRFPKLEQLQNITPEIIESLGNLVLFGVCEIGEKLRQTLDAESRDFLLFCEGIAQTRRVRQDFSYLDEIRSLQMSRRPEDKFVMINNRFSDNEGIVLDALDIGDGYDY